MRNDAIIDNTFTLNVNTDFTIDYKFKQDVPALDMEVCDTGIASDNCSHSPSAYLTGDLYPAALPDAFALSFASVPA